MDRRSRLSWGSKKARLQIEKANSTNGTVRRDILEETRTISQNWRDDPKHLPVREHPMTLHEPARLPTHIIDFVSDSSRNDDNHIAEDSPPRSKS
jgi:hypothetical protein